MANDHPLRAWRRSQVPPLTQTDLGNLIGVKTAQVSQIESWNRGPSLKVAHKITEVTGIPLGDLIEEEAA